MMNKYNTHAQRLLSVEDRFWSKVDKNGPVPEHAPDLGPCWLWTATLTHDGYGHFGIGSRKDGTRGLILAHRWSFEQEHGFLPLELDHLCRLRHCVRPSHLEGVSHAINVQRGDHRISGAWQRLKTHCPQGHEYTEANTYMNPLRRNGKTYMVRTCRACHKSARAPKPSS